MHSGRHSNRVVKLLHETALRKKKQKQNPAYGGKQSINARRWHAVTPTHIGIMCCGAIWQYNLSDDKYVYCFIVMLRRLFCYVIRSRLAVGALAVQTPHNGNIKNIVKLEKHTHQGIQQSVAHNRKTFLQNMSPPGILHQLATMLTGDFRRCVTVFVVATADGKIRIS